MKHFLLIDDHSVIRSGLRGLLSELCPGSEVKEAGDGVDALNALEKTSFDLVILDIKIPGTDTLGLAQSISSLYPATRLLIFSMNPENVYAKRFFKAGCHGFLSKESPVEEIQKAITLILSGKKYVSETLAQLLADDSAGNIPVNPFEKLSPREFEIVSFILMGKGVSEIGHLLNLRVSTIGTHKARLFKKLRVTNVVGLKELATTYHL